MNDPSTDMKAAKKIKGDVLVWWPIVKMDDDDNLTNEVEDGRWIATRFNGQSWEEPDYFEAMGSWFGDETCYASEPTHWLPAPAPISKSDAQAALTVAGKATP